MSDNRIKIGADTGDLRRSFRDISRDAKALGKERISLFNKEEREFLRSGAKAGIQGINKVIEQQNSLLTKARAEREKLVKGTDEERKKQVEIIKLLREKAKLENQSLQLQKASKELAPTGMDKMKDAVGKTSWGAKLGKFIKSPIAMGGAALLGAGAFAAHRGMEGFNTWEGGINDRVKLRGMGMRAPLRDAQGAADVGMSSLDYRSAQIQSINAFGRNNSKESDVLGRAKFERNFGLDSGSLTNAGAGLQATMGSKGANEAMMKLQASILASGIDDAIGPYLETAVGFLSQINENGTLNNTELASLIAGFTAKGESPQMVSRAFSNMQQGITGSSGEANAFFQNAFSRMGIGGKTIGGTQAAIESGGLFGMDGSKVAGLGSRKGVQGALKQLGITGEGTGSQDRAKGIVSQIMQTVGGKKGESFDNLAKRDPQSALMAGNMMKRMGLGKTAVEGMGSIGLLEDVASGKVSGEDFQKKMDKMQMSPELRNLDDIKKSAEGQYSALEAMHTTIKDELGGKLVPIADTIKRVIMNIDKGLAGALGLFGYNTESEAMKGEGILAEGTKLDKESRRSLTEEKAMLENELKTLDSQPKGAPGHGFEKDPNRSRKDQIQRKIKNIESSMSNTKTKDTEFDDFRRDQVATGAKNVQNLISGGDSANPMMSIMKEQNKLLSEIRDSSKKTSNVNVKPKIIVGNPTNKVSN